MARDNITYNPEQLVEKATVDIRELTMQKQKEEAAERELMDKLLQAEQERAQHEELERKNKETAAQIEKTAEV